MVTQVIFLSPLVTFRVMSDDQQQQCLGLNSANYFYNIFTRVIEHRYPPKCKNIDLFERRYIFPHHDFFWGLFLVSRYEHI